MIIYIRAGREIYKKRRKMLQFSGSGTGGGTVINEPFSPTGDVFAPGLKTTEVVQTTEFVQNTNTTGAGISSQPVKDPNVSYSVTISADAQAHDNDSLDGLDGETEATANGSVEDGLGKTPAVQIASTTISAAPPAANLQARRRFQRNLEANNATWSYTKCAILFFAVLLITWIPSSGNRVYSMVHHGDVSKPLFFASAFVLPLQGFWNAIIYIVTSWAACKSFFGNIAISVWGKAAPMVEMSGRHNTRPTGGRWNKAEETTSMEDLTGIKSAQGHRISPV